MFIVKEWKSAREGWVGGGGALKRRNTASRTNRSYNTEHYLLDYEILFTKLGPKSDLGIARLVIHYH